jgi:DNA-binding NtrC family response regulator
MIRILLLEDKIDQLESMVEILTDWFPGYKIYGVRSFSEAKQKIQKLGTVSLVIADYQLEDGTDETGYDLLKYCQEHLTNVPVIIITAYGRDEEKEVRAALSFQKGAFDFMQKPLDYDEFKERIIRALKISETLA